MKIDLSGKTAIVTGSTAGIGFAIAKGLAEAGAQVVVNGRNQAGVDATIAALKRAGLGAQFAASPRTSARRRAAQRSWRPDPPPTFW